MQKVVQSVPRVKCHKCAGHGKVLLECRHHFFFFKKYFIEYHKVIPCDECEGKGTVSAAIYYAPGLVITVNRKTDVFEV